MKNKVNSINSKQIAEQVKKIILDWENSGLLNGLKGINRSAIAELLECKTSYAFRESGDLISLSGI